MDNFSADFWAMNGYGVYIWWSYGLAAALLGGLGLYLYRRMRILESRAGYEG
jgi:heme exporter protein CcmD